MSFGTEAGASLVVIGGVLLFALVPALAPLPPPPPGPLVVLAIDGVTWPQLAPLLTRGALPALTRRAGGQHAAIADSPVVPFPELWRGLNLTPHVERCGRTWARYGWPTTTDIVKSEMVVLPPDASPLPTELARRLGRDRGTSAAAARRLHELPRPALLMAYFSGPSDSTAAAGDAPLAPLTTDYGNLLAAALDAVIAAAPADGTVVLIGRGTGRPGLPDGQGAWYAVGPRIVPGALPGPIHTAQLAATLLEIAGLPLPPTTPGDACDEALRTPPYPVNRRITWLSGDVSR